MTRLIVAALVVLLVPSVGSSQTSTVSFHPEAQAPPPVQQWARVAFFDVDRVARESSVGKAAAARLDDVRLKRQTEAEARTKTIQATQQKLEQTGSLLSDVARADLAKSVEKFQVDLQRFLQDAQAELQGLQRDLEQEFLRTLQPAAERAARANGFQLLLSRSDSGLVWGDPALDLTAEIIKEIERPAAPR